MSENLVKKERMNERKKEIKDFLEINKNKHRTYPMFWNTLKVPLRSKNIAIKA